VHELGLDLPAYRREFPVDDQGEFLLVVVSEQAAQEMRTGLVEAVRRSYVSDTALEARILATGRPKTAVLLSTLPPAGSVRSGDFGEILSAVFQAAHRDDEVLDPKKWRLKADRTKAAPYLDILQMVLPHWPESSADDELLAAEVKAKATGGTFHPIEKAIADLTGNRVGRIARTLGWLKDRAISTGIDGSVSLDQIERFLEASEHPPSSHQFRAIAVVDTAFVEAELASSAEALRDSPVPVYVISVPELRGVYEEIYGRLLEPDLFE
jgi:hypothetical protein